MGGGLGWEELTEGKAPLPGTPSTSVVNPTGKGSTEEKGRQKDRHTEMEKDRDKTKATWQKGRK